MTPSAVKKHRNFKSPNLPSTIDGGRKIAAFSKSPILLSPYQKMEQTNSAGVGSHASPTVNKNHSIPTGWVRLVTETKGGLRPSES